MKRTLLKEVDKLNQKSEFQYMKTNAPDKASLYFTEMLERCDDTKPIDLGHLQYFLFKENPCTLTFHRSDFIDRGCNDQEGWFAFLNSVEVGMGEGIMKGVAIAYIVVSKGMFNVFSSSLETSGEFTVPLVPDVKNRAEDQQGRWVIPLVMPYQQ